MVPTLLVAALSYLVGSIPAGDIAARLRGTSLRTAGSGNPGFTNAWRVLGPRAAVPVLIADIAKGVVAVLAIAPALGGGSPLGPTGVRLAAGVAAIAGHAWPVFAGFRGGKGVATACGVFLALSPLATLAAAAVWCALVAATRYVSLGSIAGALALPWGVWVEARRAGTAQPAALVAAAAVVAALIVARHRSNVGRLLAGTENRFGAARPAGPKGGDR
ncbi:MAG: glycerol-3-phosphate 1-O-acyltransferase PlsY [Candidatus Eisenbacteria bacterium]|nr:glycerol-3-phosphate 1-O-acyltransferase PlsY [Candidatus Eisenbacteria bacterium]